VSNYIVTDRDNTITMHLISDRDFLIKNSLKAMWDREMFPRTGAILIKKDCFKKVGNFDVRISIYEDFEFWIRLFKNFSTVFTFRVTFNHLLEFNELSKKRVPIEDYFAFYIRLRDTLFYEKLIMSYNLYITYNKYKNSGRKNEVECLLENNKKYKFFIIFSLFYNKYVGLKKRVFSKRLICS